MEDGPLIFQLAAELQCIGQVAVVAQGHGAPAMPDDHGLSIGPHPAAGSGISDMAGSHVGGRLCQRGQHRRGEHLVDKAEIPVALNDAIVVDGDAAALLAAVLQRVQGGVSGSGHVLRPGAVIDAKNAALFVKRICKIRHYSSSISFCSFSSLAAICSAMARALGSQLGGQSIVAQGQDLSGQPGGVLGAVQGHGRHRDAAGHLHGGQQGVQAVHGTAFHRDADDGQGGVGGKGTGQMGGHAGSAEDDAKTILFCALGKGSRLCRGAVCRQDVCLKRDVQRLELGTGPLDHRPIAVRTHNDCNFPNHRNPTSLSLFRSTANKKGCGTPAPRPFISAFVPERCTPSGCSGMKLHRGPDDPHRTGGRWFSAACFAFRSSSATSLSRALSRRAPAPVFGGWRSPYTYSLRQKNSFAKSVSAISPLCSPAAKKLSKVLCSFAILFSF